MVKVWQKCLWPGASCVGASVLAPSCLARELVSFAGSGHTYLMPAARAVPELRSLALAGVVQAYQLGGMGEEEAWGEGKHRWKHCGERVQSSGSDEASETEFRSW